jgi:PAT family beta-lactamase induction signal transducer AmpG
MGNATFGMYAGFIGVALPQLLARQHLPEARIASVTAVVFSPFCWIFLVSPLLDVRFSRRFYATMLAAVAAVTLAIALLNLSRLPILEAALITGASAAFLSSSALGGWLSSILPKAEETRLSSWFNVANMGGAGLIVVASGALTRHLPPAAAAALLGALIFLPTCVFWVIPAPGPDRRLARESFAQFFGEILTLLQRRPVWIALALFAAPSGSFALANVLSGLGEDYRAPATLVTLTAGAGVTLAGVAGSLGFRLLAGRLPLRPLYLAIGTAGSVFTLSLLLLPHSAWVFALALIGETAFQALAITGAYAIQFETVGQDNPLAATTFCLMGSAVNFSITYMIAIDGWAYGVHGLRGTYLGDAGAGLGACALLAWLLLATRSAARSATRGR